MTTIHWALLPIALFAACKGDPPAVVDAGVPTDAGSTPGVIQIVRGLEIYSERGCAACHCNNAQGGCNLEAPNIQQAPKEAIIANLRFAATPEENPALSDPFDPHPAKIYNLPDQDIDDLTAFLASLKDGVVQRDDSLIGKGYEMYVSAGCIGCHLMSAQGTSQGGLGQAIAGLGPDNVYAVLTGAVPCHPLQRTRPPAEVACSLIGDYITDNATVELLTDTAPPGYDNERAMLSYFLAFIAPPPTGGVVEPCNKAPGEICTVVGNGIGGYTKDEVPATESLIYFPQNVELYDWDKDGSLDLVFADWNNFRIRVVFLDKEIDGVKDKIITIAGNSKVAGDDTLNHPTDIAFQADGSLLISGWHNQVLYRYWAGIVNGGERHVLGGLCALSCPPTMPGATPAHETFFGGPVSVAVHPDGRIFMSETTCVRIRQITTTLTATPTEDLPAACPGPQHILHDTMIETYAGRGMAGYDGDDGPAVDAKFNTSRGTSLPNFGIALEHGADPGRLYVADSQNNMVRYIDIKASPPTIHHLAGVAGANGFGLIDGPGETARFNFPTNVTGAPDGSVYVADARNNAVRKIDRMGNVTTVAGNGRAGFNGDNISARSAELNNPNGVVVHPDGRIFISDTNNNRIRVIYP